MRKSLFFAGLLVLGIGFYILLLATGIFSVPGGPSSRWLIGLVGMSFVVGGGLVCLGELLKHDDAFTLRDIEFARAFRNVMIALLLIIIIILGNWVAFGPGTRPVQAIVGLPFSDIPLSASEWVGRFGFGVGAATLDFLLAAILVSIFRKRQRGQPGGN